MQCAQSPAKVVTYADNGTAWEPVEVEAFGPFDLADPADWDLSAEDLGCAPGTLHRVVLLDAEDREIVAADIEAT